MPTAKILAFGAPDFSPYVRQLLKLANVKYTADTRSSLVSTLKIAWADVQLVRKLQKQRIPARLSKSLNDSIKHTQRLLRRLEKDHLPDIATDEWAILKGRAITPGKWFDEVPSGATLVIFNRQQMLDRLLRDIARYNPKRKRGHQEERDKSAIVAYAAHFFRQYSPEEITTYSAGPFAIFCKGFYEAVTREHLSGCGLEQHIKDEVRRPTIGTQMVQKT
jgi:hypothetical protein